MNIEQELAAIVTAERKISALLRKLEAKIGRRLDCVDVDCRNFTNYSVMIVCRPRGGEHHAEGRL